MTQQADPRRVLYAELVAERYRLSPRSYDAAADPVAQADRSELRRRLVAALSALDEAASPGNNEGTGHARNSG
jgi:hypothetical protein